MESETELMTLVNLRTISAELRPELCRYHYDRKQYREQAEMLSRYNMQLQEEIRNLRILVDRLTEDAKM